jgi:hypothetical protein
VWVWPGVKRTMRVSAALPCESAHNSRAGNTHARVTFLKSQRSIEPQRVTCAKAGMVNERGLMKS